MAQSLFSYNSTSNLQSQRLQSSLISPTLPLRPASIAVPPPRRSRKTILSATQPTVVIEPTPTSQEDTKAIESEGVSLAQTNTDPSLQISPQSNILSWKKIVLGALTVLSLSFSRKALKIRDVLKNVDSVVEEVQIVAEEAEKMAKEVAQVLPNGSLKEAAFKLKKLASLVDKKAAFADSLLDQVDDAVAGLDVKLQPIITNEREIKTNDGVVASAVVSTTTIHLKDDGLQ